MKLELFGGPFDGKDVEYEGGRWVNIVERQRITKMAFSGDDILSPPYRVAKYEVREQSGRRQLWYLCSEDFR